MDSQHSLSTSLDAHVVDLAATRRRFLAAREQATAQSSTHRVRSAAITRWWQAERHGVDG
jgi:hypothetical protein